jgi:hypothetical protein
MAWGALDIFSGSRGAEVLIDPSEYDTLRFEAYPRVDLTAKVAFYNNHSYEIHLKGNRWNSVAIPLEFKEPFARFYVQNDHDNAVTCYFDDIRFSPSSRDRANGQ